MTYTNGFWDLYQRFLPLLNGKFLVVYIVALSLSLSLSLYLFLSVAFRLWLSLQKEKTKKKQTQFNPPSCVFLTFRCLCALLLEGDATTDVGVGRCRCPRRVRPRQWTLHNIMKRTPTTTSSRLKRTMRLTLSNGGYRRVFLGVLVTCRFYSFLVNMWLAGFGVMPK